MDKEDVKKDHKVNEETWGFEEEEYIKAICCYINNVGGRSLYTRVVSFGYPGLYLLFVSLYAPFC